MQTVARQGAILKLPAKSDVDIHRAVLKGLPSSTVESVVKLGFDRQLIVRAVGSRSTIERKIKAHQQLGPDESDRLARVARIIAFAESTFGDKAKALQWMTRVSKSFGFSESPLGMLATDQGMKLVEERLTQIAHGMFA